MRSAVIAAAFAVGALAVPYQNNNKRDLVTETDYAVAYTTVMVTVTAGSAPNPTPQNKNGGPGAYHHHHHDHAGNSPPADPPSPSPPAASPPAPNNSPPPSQPEPAPSPSPRTDLPSSPSPTQGSGSGGGGDNSGNPGSAGTSYSSIATYHHNIHRRNHSAPEIAWDADLQKSAADIAATCIYEHNVVMDGGGYGQNIAAGVEPNNISAIITNLFYNGEVSNYDGLYGEANPSMANFEEWGHFSQIVWKATTHFACATQDCSGKGLANVGGDVAPYFTVCNYKSPGNFGGEYGANVGEPLGEPTANWNTGL